MGAVAMEAAAMVEVAREVVVREVVVTAMEREVNLEGVEPGVGLRVAAMVAAAMAAAVREREHQVEVAKAAVATVVGEQVE